MRFRLFVALFALIALGLETSAQTAYSSTEYYVVADYRAGSSTLPLLWDNFVLRDAQSQNTTIDFSVQVASGQIGALGGPVFVVGAYEMEPIWLTATALGGSLPGHAHFQANLGNTAPADRPHFNATPDQLKGWRFTRTDGQAFRLVSVDYQNVSVPVLVGTSFTNYGSTCSWDIQGTTQGLVLGDPNWNTLSLFVSGPLPAGPGQAIVPGISVMNVNDARNANGTPVSGACYDPKGPFFATVAPHDDLSFAFEGEGSQPIVVLGSSQLTPGAANLPPVGQIDLGIPGIMGGIPSGLLLIADGTQADFFNSLFRTNPQGRSAMTFSNPGFPSGTVIALQALIFNATAGNVVQFSNAVQVTFQ